MAGTIKKPIPENLEDLSPQLRYYYENRDKILIWQNNYGKEKWKNRDPQKTKDDWNNWANKNPETNKQRHQRWYNKYGKKYQTDRYFKRRLLVITHYGGKCICCGEVEFRFIEIDHINGGGTQERLKLKKRGNRMIDWIIQNNYPKDYQLMCANCNRAKNNSGKQFCPVHHPEQYREPYP